MEKGNKETKAMLRLSHGNGHNFCHKQTQIMEKEIIGAFKQERLAVKAIRSYLFSVIIIPPFGLDSIIWSHQFRISSCSFIY